MTEQPAASDPSCFLPPELQEPSSAPDGDASPPTGSRMRPLIRGAAVLGAGLVAGAVGVALIQGVGSPTAAPLEAASSTSVPGGVGPQGPGFGRGGQPGETRVIGALTGVGANSITVTDDTGTATSVPVSSTTDIELDGQPVALSALPTDTRVLVHVLPRADGGTVAERILAGSSGTSGPGDGPPAGGPGTDPGATNSTGTTGPTDSTGPTGPTGPTDSTGTTGPTDSTDTTDSSVSTGTAAARPA